MKNFINKFKRESDEETRKRVLDLAKDIDCGMISPPMDAQVALNELKDHLLGEDWYVVDPMSTEQVNTNIVYEIERKYKRVKSFWK